MDRRKPNFTHVPSPVTFSNNTQFNTGRLNISLVGLHGPTWAYMGILMNVGLGYIDWIGLHE